MSEVENWQEETKLLLQLLYDEPDHGFIHARDLAAKSNFPTDKAQREMRRVISELIEVNHEPIIGSTQGYAIADQPQQIDRCILDLKNRCEGIQRRIEALIEIKYKMTGDLR